MGGVEVEALVATVIRRYYAVHGRRATAARPEARSGAVGSASSGAVHASAAAPTLRAALGDGLVIGTSWS